MPARRTPVLTYFSLFSSFHNVFFFFLWKYHPDVIPGISALDRQVVAPARKFGDPAAILIFGPPFEGGHASETSFHSQGMDEHFQEFRGIAQSWR